MTIFAAMSKVSALYHIVFCTKKREMSIPEAYFTDLYTIIWSIVKKSGSRLIRIGGISNHLHLLVSLHPSVCLADLVRDIKSISAAWMKDDPRFRSFIGWAREYYAATISNDAVGNVVNYINNQKEHHAAHNLDDEFNRLYRWAGLTYQSDKDMTE